MGLQLVSPEISSEVPNPNEISGGRSLVSCLLSPVLPTAWLLMRANQSLSMDSLEPFIATVALDRETFKAASTTRSVRHPVTSTLLAAISPARLGIPMFIISDLLFKAFPNVNLLSVLALFLSDYICDSLCTIILSSCKFLVCSQESPQCFCLSKSRMFCCSRLYHQDSLLRESRYCE